MSDAVAAIGYHRGLDDATSEADTPTPASELIGWGIHIDPVTGVETRVTEQRIDTKTGKSTLVRLVPAR